MADSYDLIIIGSGPGGYVTAIRAAQLGLKTAIVEREHLGGICLNWGCIPTKALLRSAEVKHYADHAKDYGLTLNGTITADVKAVVARSRGISARLNAGVGFLMKKNKVDVIWGEAKITKPGEVVVSAQARCSAAKPGAKRHARPRHLCCQTHHHCHWRTPACAAGN
jgi:dihydrolipoamide dehydrogenase